MKTIFLRAPQMKVSDGGSLIELCRREAALFEGVFTKLQELPPEANCALEIFGAAHSIGYYLTIADEFVETVTSLIYAAFPDAELSSVKDPAESFKGGAVYEITLARPDLIPFKDMSVCDSDPLAGLLNVLSELTTGERALFQLVISPVKESFWFQLKKRRAIRAAKRHLLLSPAYWLQPQAREELKKRINAKCHERLLETSLRVAVASEKDAARLKRIIETLEPVFTSFGAKDWNNFQLTKISSTNGLKRLSERRLSRPFLLTAKECATLYHLPPSRLNSNVERVITHREPAPKDIPTDKNDPEISFFGESNFRSQRVPFGIQRIDRRRHAYVLGKSGVGKSKLMELLIQNDLRAGRGVGVLDPHGDLVDNVLKLVPKDRIKDVVLFDPSDLNFPPALNPLEHVPEQFKMRLCIGFIEIFKKLFGNNWSPRLEHVLRYTTLALLDTPDTTVLSILKMLTDKRYRQDVVKNIRDDVVKNFWVNEFAGWSEKFDSEAITPLLNKVGQFVSTNMIRNIVGQSKNLIDFREIMDSKKILLAKVSKGILGEENAGLLGAMIITKLFQAAMSRADTPEEKRVDFYFYVDEFQSFATDTFDEILSEARKYRLCLTIANQFLGQLNDRIRTTVFGNVGSIVSFRVGGADAGHMAAEFAPRFHEQDLINLGVREFITKLSVKGETVDAFSARTLPLNFPKEDFTAECIAHSRATYARPLKDVEKMLGIVEPKSETVPNAPIPVTQTISEPEDFSEPIL